jgi:uncharacterized protein YgbK (DUF1537 family)
MVICVLADDFTGAAEIAGVAFRYGLVAEVQTEYHNAKGADLICLDNDSRSCTSQEAVRRVAEAAEQYRRAGVEVFYKKVDSVLRGRITAELAAMIDVLGKKRALLVPANPTLGRVIHQGTYLVGGQPLHQTHFALDPEYPIDTSDVREILEKTGSDTVHVLAAGKELPQSGIVLGEAGSSGDVAAWARRLDGETIPAGAAEFFAAYLERMGFEPKKDPVVSGDCLPGARTLFVCGSTSDSSRAFCRRCEEVGLPVLRMPSNLFDVDCQADPLIEEWSRGAVLALKRDDRAMVAIDRPLRHDPGLPQRLSDYLADVVRRVLEQIEVDCIFAEGGATAAALARRLGWKRMIVRQEWQPGVVSLQPQSAKGLLLTMKPGSYPWPDQFLTTASRSE